MEHASFLWSFIVIYLLAGVRGQTFKWLQTPDSVSAQVGDNVTFTCRVSNPNPKAVWKVDTRDNNILFVDSDRWTSNTRFSVINKYDLVITNVQKVDNGRYTCEVRDVGIQTATLTVLLRPGPPRITRDVPGPTYKAGDIVKFTCASTGGNPDPTITWMKNGNITSAIAQNIPSTELGGTSSSILTVTLDRSDHQADYSCIVYNELNKDNRLTDSIVLRVQYAPHIGFRPYFPVYSVKRGQNVDITCDVNANPSVTSVTWTKDSVALPDTSPQISIANVEISDQGSYECTATNSIGSRSANVQLDVQYAPVLDVPTTSTINEGEDLTIDCDVQANPDPYDVHWLKVNNRGPSITLSSTKRLEMKAVGKDATGNYSCKAQSQLKISGEKVEFVESQVFTYVYVRYKPGTASIGSVPDMDVDERLDITCTASPTGYPEPTYIWTKDGSTLPQNRQIYTIESVSLSDNGVYTCTPNNVRGNGVPASVTVNIYEPPEIIRKPSVEVSVFLTEPKLLSLTCEAKGYPKPRITWRQEGTSLPLNGIRSLFTVVETSKPVGPYGVEVKSLLQFEGSDRQQAPSGQRTKLQIRDLGNYTCHVESDKHTDTPTAQTILNINFPPVLMHTPTRYAVSRTTEVKLTCKAQAYPNPEFQWYFLGQPLTSNQWDILVAQKKTQGVGSFTGTLTITNVSDDSYGVYQCVVVNSLGNVTHDIQVTTKAPPEQPTGLKVVSTSWDSIFISWQPGFNGGYQQQFYIYKLSPGEKRQEIEVKPISSKSFNVTSLRPSITYTFQVFAANQLGPSPLSATATATTNSLLIPPLADPPVFNAKLRKLVVLSPDGNEYCLKVRVKSSGSWDLFNSCMTVAGDTLEIARSDITAVNVSVCLSRRTDVCGPPVSAEINSSDKSPALTEEHVIIIACVCGVIIVTLLIVLFCFICRRKRNAAKNYQEQNSGDPPPYNAVPPSKKPQHVQSQGYDNQGMDTSDLGLPTTRLHATAPTLPLEPSPDVGTGAASGSRNGGPASSSSPPVHANKNGFINNSYGPLDLLYSHQEMSQPPHRQEPMVFLNPNTLDRDNYDNASSYPYRDNNNRMDGYPNRDGPTAGGVPNSPNKDKYIDLQDRGVDLTDQGYNPSEAGGKPKKVIYEVVV